jgi:nucleoside-diphosphate-sugar epimerase
MMTDSKTALILGATGGVGHETALALFQRGWRIRALHRDPARARPTMPQAEWVGGDAMHASDVAAAVEGADLIVHGVNPPGYQDWQRLALPMLENTIVAAAASGARIVFPGTIYNYGPDAFPVLSETSPQNPCSRKGAIRVEMERRLRRASEKDGVRVLILRGGDFFWSAYRQFLVLTRAGEVRQAIEVRHLSRPP